MFSLWQNNFNDWSRWFWNQTISTGLINGFEKVSYPSTKRINIIYTFSLFVYQSYETLMISEAFRKPTLTLKRLEEGQSDLYVVFPKMWLLERGWSLVFFGTFNIIVRHIFPENVIEINQVVQKIWSFSPSILTNFSDFLDFLTYPCYKETNGITYEKWHQHFLLSTYSK